MSERRRVLETIGLRFQAIRDDYERDSKGVKTCLAIDTCDLLTYMHIGENRGLSSPERAVRDLFEAETLERVLLPPHAFEVLNYLFKILKNVSNLAETPAARDQYIDRYPEVLNFVRAFEDRNYDEASRLWNTGVWAGILGIARDGGRGAIEVVRRPFGNLYRLLESGKIKALDQFQAGNARPRQNDEVVGRALRAFRGLHDRVDKDINNMVDACALGIVVDLNERPEKHDRYFSMTTLSGASLTAYSRAVRPDERASICRNSFVSAYRRNLGHIPAARDAELEYMEHGVSLLESILAEYKSLRDLRNGGGIGADQEIALFRFSADYLEYYNNYFKPIIEPAARDAEGVAEDAPVEEVAEILKSESRFADAMKTAHAEILEETQQLAKHIRRFVVGGDESLGVDIELGGRQIHELVDEMVGLIEEQGTFL